jgi:hypothetical protein
LLPIAIIPDYPEDFLTATLGQTLPGRKHNLDWVVKVPGSTRTSLAYNVKTSNPPKSPFFKGGLKNHPLPKGVGGIFNCRG